MNNDVIESTLKVGTVGEEMTDSVQAINSATSIATIKGLMAEFATNHLPVVDDGHIVGLVTDRDLKLAQAVSSDPNFHNSATARDVLVAPYVTAPDTPLDDVLTVMLQRRIGSAIVVEHGVLLGIFTRSDACRVLVRILRGTVTND